MIIIINVICIYTARQAQSHIERHTSSQTGREGGKQANRQAGRQRDWYK